MKMTYLIVRKSKSKNAIFQKKKANVEAKNGLESVIYQAKNQLGEKIPTVKDYLDKQVSWLESNPNASTEEYKRKTKEVQEYIQLEATKKGRQPTPNAQPTAPETNMPDVDEID